MKAIQYRAYGGFADCSRIQTALAFARKISNYEDE
jgi:hypothetical protein